MFDLIINVTLKSCNWETLEVSVLLLDVMESLGVRSREKSEVGGLIRPSSCLSTPNTQ